MHPRPRQARGGRGRTRAWAYMGEGGQGQAKGTQNKVPLDKYNQGKEAPHEDKPFGWFGGIN